MRTQIRAELTQLRTLRSTYGVLGLALAIAVGITVGNMTELGKANMDSFAELREGLMVPAGAMVAVVFAIFAANRTGAEFRHDTIGQRVLGAPRRWRLVAAKATTFATIAAIVGAIGAAVAIPVVKAMASHKGIAFDPSTGQMAAMVGEVMIVTALFAVIGVAIGFIARSQTAAIMAILGTFIVEQLITGLLGTAGHYMPYALLDSALDVGKIAPVTAGLVLAGMVTAVTAVSVTLFRQRDV